MKLYEQEIGAITPLIADAILDACDTYPIDWIPEAIEIAVSSNKRSWRYVEGILRNCKAKNVRPSLNRLEKSNGNNGTGVTKRTKQSRPEQDDTPGQYSDADRAAAERVRQRQQRLPAV
jgi:DnaD/phage-associated family protein